MRVPCFAALVLQFALFHSVATNTLDARSPAPLAPPTAESLPPLVPVWTTKLPGSGPEPPEMYMGIAFIDGAVIALSKYSTASEYKWSGNRLRSLDPKTGRMFATIELPFKELDYSDGPMIYASGSTSVAVQLPGSLAEFDPHLKLLAQIKLPPGRRLSRAKWYGYGEWAQKTKSQCQAPIDVFDLHEGSALIVACDHEVGILDRSGKLAFVENFPNNAVGSPQIAAAGKRFILPLHTTLPGDPPLESTSYAMYDLISAEPRKTVFSIRASGSGNAVISASGMELAILDQGKVAVYTLPQ